MAKKREQVESIGIMKALLIITHGADTQMMGVLCLPFSLLKLWSRSEQAGRLHGLVHDGDWFHVGTPAALAAAERVLG